MYVSYIDKKGRYIVYTNTYIFRKKGWKCVFKNSIISFHFIKNISKKGYEEHKWYKKKVLESISRKKRYTYKNGMENFLFRFFITSRIIIFYL